ncbi:MAG TPA: 50S ribosomal protein L21 [Ferruginibacter sp.]|nr:50S ribosomal protein L21 [Ferruginibacter sp.]
MLAIVKIAGQQFKVKAGDSLYVPHIEGKTGDNVEFAEVLLTSEGDKLKSGNNIKAVVKAEILNDLVKGDKVIAFKMIVHSKILCLLNKINPFFFNNRF